MPVTLDELYEVCEETVLKSDYYFKIEVGRWNHKPSFIFELMVNENFGVSMPVTLKLFDELGIDFLKQRLEKMIEDADHFYYALEPVKGE